VPFIYPLHHFTGNSYIKVVLPQGSPCGRARCNSPTPWSAHER